MWPCRQTLTLFRKAINVVHVDADNERHQPDEQFVHGLVFDSFIRGMSDDSPGDSPGHHQHQVENLEIRHASCYERGDEACNL